jgi:hypothetical protein
MRKTSPQHVHESTKTVQKLRTKCMQFLAQIQLSTIRESYTHFCAQVMRRVVHTVLCRITEVGLRLSPLSTALIREHKMEYKY